MHPINPEGTCPRKPRSSWHCLAIIDSVWASFVEVGARHEPRKYRRSKGWSVPT